MTLILFPKRHGSDYYILNKIEKRPDVERSALGRALETLTDHNFGLHWTGAPRTPETRFERVLLSSPRAEDEWFIHLGAAAAVDAAQNGDIGALDVLTRRFLKLALMRDLLVEADSESHRDDADEL